MIMNINFASINCKGFNRSKNGILNFLAESNIHVAAIQETWLAKQELDSLNSLSNSFNAFGISKINYENGLTVGRNSGGVAFLWSKQLHNEFIVDTLDFHDDWLAGLELIKKSDGAKYLLINAYLPYKCEDNKDAYTACISKLLQVVEDADTSNILLCGDFNCDPRQDDFFAQLLVNLCSDSGLVVSDNSFLPQDTFTFVSDCWSSTSWIDHILCSTDLHSIIQDIRIDYGQTWSDHRPIVASLNLQLSPSCANITQEESFFSSVNWDLPGFKENYHESTSHVLAKVDLSDVVFCRNPMCTDSTHKDQIDKLYCDIVHALKTSSPTPKLLKQKPVPGWNDYVRDLHAASRESFLLWKDAGKPRHGLVYNVMKQCKTKFKYAMRHCRNNEDTLRADALAKKLSTKKDYEFWRDIRNINNSKVALPNCIGENHGAKEITDMWFDYYNVLFNAQSRNAFPIGEICVFDDAMIVNTQELSNCLACIPGRKAPGPDGLTVEHFKYASNEIVVLLALLFSSMFIHGYMPLLLIESLLVPIVKNKCASLTAKENYRPIALSNIVTKMFERLILNRIDKYMWTYENQFGFKKGCGTDLCIYLFKELVNSYNCQGSSVFCCFLDASKAFDRVNHTKLFSKLKVRGVPIFVLRVLAFWYYEQTLVVKWGRQLSKSMNVSNGVRQGGILSPILFNVYMNDLSVLLKRDYAGLCYGDERINHLMYADDIVLFAPSVAGLQMLIDTCKKYGDNFDIVFNSKKTVSLSIKCNARSSNIKPEFILGNDRVAAVSEVKYLGHVITDTLCDDKDMLRQIRSLYCRSNMLIRKFSRCSDYVKTKLFQSFCSNMYCCSVWFKYSSRVYNKLRVAYNNSCRILLGLPRHCSASQMFVNANVLSFGEILRKACYSLLCRVEKSYCYSVTVLYNLVKVVPTSIASKWREVLYLHY